MNIIDNSNIRKALIKALKEGMKYEDMTPRMQEEYDKISLIANYMIDEVLEQIQVNQTGNQLVDLLEKLGQDIDLSELTEEENKLREAILESLEIESKEKLEIADDKEELINKIKLKLKIWAKTKNAQYKELFINEIGQYQLKLLCDWITFNSRDYKDLFFIIKNADHIEIAEYVDEENPEYTAQFVFDFSSYLK